MFCDMVTLGGGWERVAQFEASAMTTCPSDEFQTFGVNGIQLCSNNGTIVDVRITPSTTFSEIIGAASAYASGNLYAFRPDYSLLKSREFHGRFMDGVAVMLDDTSGALKHVYSYGIGKMYHAEAGGAKVDSACNSFGASNPLSAIGSNYMCSLIDTDNEAGASNPLSFGDLSDELCVVYPRTCARPSAWFHRQLTKDYDATDTQIVLRLLSQYPGEIMLGSYVIYVR